jgi:hypothetical protein
VTQFFERRIIEAADQQCHECHDGGKDRNYTKEIRHYGNHHSGYSERYAPRRCKADRRAKVSLFDALILVNGH